MNHIDQHTLERYVLKLGGLESSSKQIEQHLLRCAGCRELHQEIVRFYARAEQNFASLARSARPQPESIVPIHRRKLAVAAKPPAGFLSPIPLSFVSFVRYLKKHPIVAGTGTLALSSVIWGLSLLLPTFKGGQNPAYASLNPSSAKLEVYNEANMLLWEIPVSGIEGAREVEAQEDLSSVIVTDLDGDGRNEVLATLERIGVFKADEGATLVIFSSDGGILGRGTGEYSVQFRGEKYSHAWLTGGMVVADFDGDGKKEIICRALSARSPSALVRFDVRGRTLGEYWHYGHQLKLAPVRFDHNGRTMLIVGGSNDANGGGSLGFATLAILDPARISGKVEATTTRGFGYEPSGAELSHIRFPNTPLNIRYRVKPAISSIDIDSTASGQRIHAWWHTNIGDGSLIAEYLLGANLSVLMVKSSDSTTRLLARLENSGEISQGEERQFLQSLRSGVEIWNGSSWQPNLILESASR